MEKEVIVKWKIKESETERVLELIQDLALETRKEKGNILYSVYQSQEDKNQVFLHERYASEQAMEDHKISEHYTNIVVGQILPRLEIREITIVKKII